VQPAQPNHPVNGFILIFASDDFLRMAFQTNGTWFMDGTFKICPAIFYQYFTIHITLQKKMIPIVRALPFNAQISTNI